MEALQNRIYEKVIEKKDLAQYHQDFNIISTKLVGGKPLIHVYSEGEPAGDFRAIAPNLEDVFFKQILDS